jgi:hypothetical protein
MYPTTNQTSVSFLRDSRHFFASPTNEWDWEEVEMFFKTRSIFDSSLARRPIYRNIFLRSHATSRIILSHWHQSESIFLMVQCYYTLYYSTLLHATPHYSTLLHATLRRATLVTLHYSTQLYATLRDSTRLYATLLFSTLLYATLRYSTLL